MKKAENYREIAPYIGLGTQLAATIVIMFFLGKWLDEKTGWFPVLTIFFALFGGFAAIYNFIKTVLQLNDKNKSGKNG